MERNIIKCPYESCKPWIGIQCNTCNTRPFRIYQGNGNTDKIREICERLNVHGVMVSPGGCSNPTKRFHHFAIDNGAFSSYINQKKWDGRAYKKYLHNHLTKGIPDFVVTPDLVANGPKSLKFSIGWNKWIRVNYPTINQYLAVQDGMTLEDVQTIIFLFDGLFIGGSLDWKYSTASYWANFAHIHGLPCHIGRVGTKEKIMWAKWNIKADSIDSSSWAQNDSWHHIEAVNAQQAIDVIM